MTSVSGDRFGLPASQVNLCSALHVIKLVHLPMYFLCEDQLPATLAELFFGVLFSRLSIMCERCLYLNCLNHIKRDVASKGLQHLLHVATAYRDSAGRRMSGVVSHVP